MLRLDAVNRTLANHTPEHFPFLSQYANTRNRTIFYATLGELLFMEDSAEKFAAFMAPLGVLCDRLTETATGNPAAFRAEDAKAALIGLFRDLRGIASAANSRRTYGLLFDWSVPAKGASAPARDGRVRGGPEGHHAAVKIRRRIRAEQNPAADVRAEQRERHPAVSR